MDEQANAQTTTVIRPPDAPIAPISETICLADMTQVERERFADKLGCKKFKSHVSDCNKRGLYELAKRDVCKEAKEAREKEEQEKSKLLSTLKERNQILEQHARELETKVNTLTTQNTKMQKDINKLSGIVDSLIKIIK